MKKWFIPELLFNKSLDQIPLFDLRNMVNKKKIGLYNKNDGKIYYWKNPVKCVDRYGYFAERNSCPVYFQKVVIEISRLASQKQNL